MSLLESDGVDEEPTRRFCQNVRDAIPNLNTDHCAGTREVDHRKGEQAAAESEANPRSGKHR